MAGPGNEAAGDLVSRVPCARAGEIIRLVVNDDGFSQDLAHREAIRQKGHKGKAIVAEQRRKVARVMGMPAAVRIVVGAHIRKRVRGIPGARSSLVDMKAKDSLAAGRCAMGKSPNLRIDHNA